MRGQGQTQILFSCAALLSVKAQLPPEIPCTYLFHITNRAEKASGEWHHCSFKQAAGGERLYLIHGTASPGTHLLWLLYRLCTACFAAQIAVINANPQHSPALFPIGLSTSALCFIQGHSSRQASLCNTSIAICKRSFITGNKSCQGVN